MLTVLKCCRLTQIDFVNEAIYLQLQLSVKDSRSEHLLPTCSVVTGLETSQSKQSNITQSILFYSSTTSSSLTREYRTFPEQIS